MTFLNMFFYPKRCAACDELLELREYERGFCRSCESRLPRPVKISETSYALFGYGGVMKNAMYRFKYQNRRCCAKTYVNEIKTRLPKSFVEKLNGGFFDAIIPLPMNKDKKKVRGYDQAEVFARAIGREFHIPVYADLVERTRKTTPMKGLSPRMRANNLKNAFKIRRNALQLNRVLIVDDIYTTGATTNAVKDVLKNAKPIDVYCLYICGSMRADTANRKDAENK